MHYCFTDQLTVALVSIRVFFQKQKHNGQCLAKLICKIPHWKNYNTVSSFPFQLSIQRMVKDCCQFSVFCRPLKLKDVSAFERNPSCTFHSACSLVFSPHYFLLVPHYTLDPECTWQAEALCLAWQFGLTGFWRPVHLVSSEQWVRQRNLAILLACQICQCEDSLNEANLGSVPTVGHRERERERGRERGFGGEWKKTKDPPSTSEQIMLRFCGDQLPVVSWDKSSRVFRGLLTCQSLLCVHKG